VNSSKLGIWSTLECGLGIAAGSLATLRPLFRRFLSTARNTLTTTRQRISRRYSRVSYPAEKGSPRSSRSGGSFDFAWKHPFAGFKRASADLETGRGSSPTNSTTMSEVYDGKSPTVSRMGTETTITVGMVPSPAPAYGHRHKRSFSRSSNRSDEKIPPPNGTGGGLWPIAPGGIEKKTMFETVTEECGSSSNSDAASDKDTKYTASVYSQDSTAKDDEDVPDVPKLPKSWEDGKFF
jgi:hypothetical protein